MNINYSTNNFFFQTVITMASSGDEDIPLHLYHAIIRGLERLVVSFSLSREDSDFLVKFSVDRCVVISKNYRALFRTTETLML